jgi:hypothetical protein
MDVGSVEKRGSSLYQIIEQMPAENQRISAKSPIYYEIAQTGEKPISQFAVASQASVPEIMIRSG